MKYFHILVGMRGAFTDSSEMGVHECADVAALHAIIAEKVDWYAETFEDVDPSVDACTMEQAQALWDQYTAPNAPYLPTCAASWDEGRTGVMVSGATESEFAVQQITDNEESWEAPSGTVYFLAPAMLAAWTEYGPESGEDENVAEFYEAQYFDAFAIPKDAMHKVCNCHNGEEFTFVTLHRFKNWGGQTYRGSACVLAYVPSMPD